MPLPKEVFEGTGTELSPAMRTFARMSLRKCIVCRQPNRSQMEEDYYYRRKTAGEIGLELHCSTEQVSEHMRQHVKHEIQQKVPSEFVAKLASDAIDGLSMITEVTQKLYDRTMAALDTEFDPEIEAAVKSVASELRNYIKDMAILKGELCNVPVVNMQLVNIQFNQLKQMVLSDLCPICRAKILTKLNGEVYEVVEQSPTQ
jgi:hypothetical protein